MSGGGLIYEEAIALRSAFATDRNYGWMLDKCRLKETIGWVAGWLDQADPGYRNRNGVLVYVYNPFSGFGKDMTGEPEMYLAYFSDEEVSRLTYGQRIKFRGELELVDTRVAVRNPKYTLLEDDPAVPQPTADELKDLEIRLDQSFCRGRGQGSCPDYTLTITSDGKVIFEGRDNTRVKGTLTTPIDKAKLEELATDINRVEFFGLLDEYPKWARGFPQYPRYTLSIRMGGDSKTVTVYGAGPRRLSFLQERIEQIVNSERWIRYD